ncbi:uncharacterized protein LOC135168742 [Diachasmimorpha longicaudata]|uniref:uncharacterized protein LOC135168742 n=1 Tax=Diachasmimorpha longicaudata TaxID=58733 RepID=UPI0030B86D54
MLPPPAATETPKFRLLGCDVREILESHLVKTDDSSIDILTLKMSGIHQLLLILVVGGVSCSPDDCTVSQEWRDAKEECQKEMDMDDECFWRCTHDEIHVLNDAGELSEDIIRNVFRKLVDGAPLQEALDKAASRCFSEIGDEVKGCDQSAMFHKCLWKDQDYVQAAKDANHCIEIV